MIARSLVAAVLAAALACTASTTRAAEPMRSHLGIHVGSVHGLAKDASGEDLFPRTSGALRLLYRGRWSERVDFTFEARAWWPHRSDSDPEPIGMSAPYEVTAVGPGVRWSANRETDAVRPYLQSSVYWVHEQATAEGGASGVGASAGLGGELRLASWLSIDAESYLLYAHPRADVSSWGVLGGLTWHVGRVSEASAGPR